MVVGKGISNQGVLNQYEGLPWTRFGGANDDDSSGVLAYLRLDGPGLPLMVDRELNGITLCAVGRKTVIHHVQVHRDDDDGIEWFGGAVNADHLVVTNETDDGFDLDHGFQGNVDYAIGIQRMEAPRPRDPGSVVPLEPVGDNVIECSSSQGGEPRKSSGHWSHLTLIDNGVSGGVMDAKEDCAGSWEKAVMFASGIATNLQSDWAFRFQGDFVMNNLLAAKAGAIVDGDLWYKDWTFPGSLDFPLGDGPPGAPQPAVAIVATQVPADLKLASYCPLDDGWAILQEPLEVSRVDSSGSVLWSWQGGPGWRGTHVRPTLDGGVAVSAVGTDFRNPRAQLVRLNSAGGVVYQGTRELFLAATILDFVQAPDSGFLFSLSGRPGDEDQGWMAKIDKLGNTEWEKKPIGFRSALANSLKPTADGGYILAGESRNRFGDQSAVILKIDSIGQAQWQQSFSNISTPRGLYAEPTSDGGYLLVGEVFNITDFDYRAGIAKVDSLGNRLWTETFPAAVQGMGGKWTGALATQGGTLLLGYREGLTISKVDDQGALLWELPQVGAFGGAAPRLFLKPSGKAAFCFSRPGLTGNPISCATLQE
ncbi:MAG: hypothetical protein ABI036_20630 [Fibrobacteria bacterium]